MNAKRQRDKNRRRASRMAQQAWEAADEENFDLAVKIIRRAVELSPGNPVLWHDQGVLLLKLDEDEKAARSFEVAIQLAPDFADAFASLAEIRARQGHAELAAKLQRQAVRHAPSSTRQQNTLAAYEALASSAQGGEALSGRQAASPLGECPTERRLPGWWAACATRIQNLDWPEVDRCLTARGLAHVPALLDSEPCETLRAMFDVDRLFAKTVAMNKARFGSGTYRYFAAPIPEPVNAIRRAVDPHVAEVANRWQELLGHLRRYPTVWTDFRCECAAAGQTTPSPLMLRYEAGGFNALHQDIRGAAFFPVQLVIVLSPRAGSAAAHGAGFAGGEFLLCDQPERRPSDRQSIPAGLGDAILFFTRERLVRVGGAYGLTPVKHGLARIASGVRYAMGLPFHEFA
jgi:hypothetical protein